MPSRPQAPASSGAPVPGTVTRAGRGGVRAWRGRLRSLRDLLLGPDGPVEGELGVLSYYLLLLTTLLLLTIGLIMVFSTRSVATVAAGRNPYLEFAQYGAFAVAGLVGMAVLSRRSTRFLSRVAWPVFVVSVLLQMLVLVPGVQYCTYGNCNWIQIPAVGTVQPSEFVKLALALVLGSGVQAAGGRITEGRVLTLRLLLPSGVALGSVMVGGDLGTVLVMALLVAAALWMAGLPKRWFAGVGVLGTFLVVAATGLSANRRARVTAWLHPDAADPTGVGYQPLHGLWALATGGWWGVGPGSSRQKWGYLTQADSDYVFAVLGEEFGLVGTLLVVVLFAALGYAMFRVIRRHSSDFVTVTTAAVSGWVLGQAAINMMVVAGMLPVLGVPLPLISAGGSALVSVLLAIGVLLAFARHEPGAEEALASRASAVRRTLAVIAPRRRNRA